MVRTVVVTLLMAGCAAQGWAGEIPSADVAQWTQATRVVQALRVVRVEASSQYPTDGSNYDPGNAVDGDPTTAWFPQRTDRANKGEWIRFHFASNVVLDRVELINGWIKDDRLWRHNSRVKKAILGFSDGTAQVIELADTQNRLRFALPGPTTRWVQLTIDEIYPGAQWNIESGITDVYFSGSQAAR